jgi:hypothetical protein
MGRKKVGEELLYIVPLWHLIADPWISNIP